MLMNVGGEGRERGVTSKVSSLDGSRGSVQLGEGQISGYPTHQEPACPRRIQIVEKRGARENIGGVIGEMLPLRRSNQSFDLTWHIKLDHHLHSSLTTILNKSLDILLSIALR
jgi:hypothetical protein